MKILLISPKGAFLSRSAEFGEFVQSSREMQVILHYWNGIGAALPTVAGLTPRQHECSIVDENLEPIDYDAKCDIVGLTAMTQQAPRAYEIAAEFRRRGRYTVIGGIHATVLPDEAGRHADTVFVGEAENTWGQFLQDFQAGAPKSVYRQRDYPPVDMLRIPCPRYDLIARYRYPVVWIQSTRGCPHDCDFCSASAVYGAKYRHKSVHQVVTEVQAVKRYWKFAQVGFADDNMFVNKPFVHRLLEEFRRLRFTWYAQSDISFAEDEHILKELHESGCRIVLIGLESTSRENVDHVNRDGWKARRLDRYPEYIDAIQRHGIGVYGAFILGMDADDLQTSGRIVDFIFDNHVLGTQVTILTPFPGCRLRQRLESEGRILHDDWQQYTGWNPVFRHTRLSHVELHDGLLAIYREVYSQRLAKRRAAYFREVCTELVSPVPISLVSVPEATSEPA